MNALFENASAFNGDVSAWNISKVTSTRFMFSGAAKFDGDISAWDTSNVTSMSYMFYNAAKFKQNISAWDVRKVKYKADFSTGALQLPRNHIPPKFR